MLRVTEGVASGEPDWPEWGRKLSFCAVVLRKWLFSSHGSELHKFLLAEILAYFHSLFGK